jgi:Gpi18-like mannosyltransferase
VIKFFNNKGLLIKVFNYKKFKPYLVLSFLVLLSTVLLWTPFLLRVNNWFSLKIADSSFQYIYKNYDGPLYIIVAKTFYDPLLIDKLYIELKTSPYYFAAHLPLYPLTIKVFAFFLGFLKAMIFSNLFFTFFLSFFFFFLIRRGNLSPKPLFLTIIFLFLPRFLIIRSIGAPESLFILLILLSLYSFEKKRYLLAGIFGGLATITKTPGILLFPTYFLTLTEGFIRLKKIKWQAIGIFLIPLSLLGLFFLYLKQYNNFFAYFNKESLVPLAFPFSVFNFQKKWVETSWLEEIIFYFFIFLLTTIRLRNFRYRSFFYFSLVFFTALIFVQHRDISRYGLPLWPMTCLAFHNFFTSKEFSLAFIILLPAIYLYAWNYLVFNVLPISNWQSFL